MKRKGKRRKKEKKKRERQEGGKEKGKKGRKLVGKIFRNTKSIKLTKITTMQFTNGPNLMSF